MVRSTSTRVFGVTKPATPETSFTRIVRARFPSEMMMGRPPPAPLGASLLSSNGSFSWRSLINPRPTTSWGLPT